jgi:hypothetical protein
VIARAAGFPGLIRTDKAAVAKVKHGFADGSVAALATFEFPFTEGVTAAHTVYVADGSVWKVKG